MNVIVTVSVSINVNVNANVGVSVGTIIEYVNGKIHINVRTIQRQQMDKKSDILDTTRMDKAAGKG